MTYKSPRTATFLSVTNWVMPLSIFNDANWSETMEKKWTRKRDQEITAIYYKPEVKKQVAGESLFRPDRSRWVTATLGRPGRPITRQIKQNLWTDRYTDACHIGHTNMLLQGTGRRGGEREGPRGGRQKDKFSLRLLHADLEFGGAVQCFKWLLTH